MKIRVTLEVNDDDPNAEEYPFESFLEYDVIPQAQDIGYQVKIISIEKLK